MYDSMYKLVGHEDTIWYYGNMLNFVDLWQYDSDTVSYKLIVKKEKIKNGYNVQGGKVSENN